MTRIVLVPGVLALLPEYAGLVDPVADLRSACRDAVAWLVEPGDPVRVLAGAQGARVAASLLAEAPAVPSDGPAHLLVVANGSARRGEKAPGHLDERAGSYDDALGLALRTGDTAALSGLDVALGRELLADVEPLVQLGGLLAPGTTGRVDLDDDPFGVQYWVMRWDA